MYLVTAVRGPVGQPNAQAMFREETVTKRGVVVGPSTHRLIYTRCHPKSRGNSQHSYTATKPDENSPGWEDIIFPGVTEKEAMHRFDKVLGGVGTKWETLRFVMVLQKHKHLSSPKVISAQKPSRVVFYGVW